MNCEEKYRIEELDILRFIAILFVMANHLVGLSNIFLISILSHATSPIMACITSYLLFRTIDDPSQFIGKIYKRIYTLVVPYLLWTFITYLFFQAIKFIIVNTFGEHSYFIKTPAIWSLNEYFYNYLIKPNPVSFWYIQNLILILPFSYLIYFMVNNKFILMIFIPFLVIMYSFNLIPYFSERFLPYFIFGAWLGLNFRSGIPAISCNKIILYVLLLTLMIVNEIDFFPVGIFRSTFIFINQIFIFLIALDIIRKNRNLRIFKYFRSKLNSSFYLHAAHMQVMFLIFSIYGLINLIYNLNLIYLEYLLPFVVFILSFIIIDGIANLMRVKTPRAYSLLSGKRKI